MASDAERYEELFMQLQADDKAERQQAVTELRDAYNDMPLHVLEDFFASFARGRYPPDALPVVAKVAEEDPELIPVHVMNAIDRLLAQHRKSGYSYLDDESVETIHIILLHGVEAHRPVHVETAITELVAQIGTEQWTEWGALALLEWMRRSFTPEQLALLSVMAGMYDAEELHQLLYQAGRSDDFP